MVIEQNKNSVAVCPFCGGLASFCSARHVVGHGEYCTDFFVRCNVCGASGPKFDDWMNLSSRPDVLAVEAWNNRFDQSCKNRGGSR